MPRQVSVSKTIVIGRSGYSLAEGKTALVTVRLSKLLSGTIHPLATATVQRGSTATRNLTLVPAPTPKRHKQHD